MTCCIVRIHLSRLFDSVQTHTAPSFQGCSQIVCAEVRKTAGGYLNSFLSLMEADSQAERFPSGVALDDHSCILTHLSTLQAMSAAAGGGGFTRSNPTLSAAYTFEHITLLIYQKTLPFCKHVPHVTGKSFALCIRDLTLWTLHCHKLITKICRCSVF